MFKYPQTREDKIKWIKKVMGGYHASMAEAIVDRTGNTPSFDEFYQDTEQGMNKSIEQGIGRSLGQIANAMNPASLGGVSKPSSADLENTKNTIIYPQLKQWKEYIEKWKDLIDPTFVDKVNGLVASSAQYFGKEVVDKVGFAPGGTTNQITVDLIGGATGQSQPQTYTIDQKTGKISGGDITPVGGTKDVQAPPQGQVAGGTGSIGMGKSSATAGSTGINQNTLVANEIARAQQVWANAEQLAGTGKYVGKTADQVRAEAHNYAQGLRDGKIQPQPPETSPVSQTTPPRGVTTNPKGVIQGTPTALTGGAPAQGGLPAAGGTPPTAEGAAGALGITPDETTGVPTTEPPAGTIRDENGNLVFNTGNPAFDEFLNGIYKDAWMNELQGQDPNVFFNSDAFKAIKERVDATWGETFKQDLQRATEDFDRTKAGIEAEKTKSETGLKLQKERTLEDTATQKVRLARNFNQAMEESTQAMASRKLTFSGIRKKEAAKLEEGKAQSLGDIETAQKRSLEDIQGQQNYLFGGADQGAYGRQLAGQQATFDEEKRRIEGELPVKYAEERERIRTLGSQLLANPQYYPQS